MARGVEIRISFSEPTNTYYVPTLRERIELAAGGFGNRELSYKLGDRHGSDLLRRRAGREDRGHEWAGSLRGTSAARAARGESGVPYSAGSITKEMAITQAQYDAFREGVTDIEGKEYGHMGGAGGRYAGRYQMGPGEITETANRLGVARPDTSEFLSNKAEQEQFFENYTLDHHRQLMRNPRYAAMSKEQQLEILGYAHNQGVGGAENYINSGRAGADAWGTSGTAYFAPIRQREKSADNQTPSTSYNP